MGVQYWKVLFVCYISAAGVCCRTFGLVSSLKLYYCKCNVAFIRSKIWHFISRNLFFMIHWYTSCWIWVLQKQENFLMINCAIQWGPWKFFTSGSNRPWKTGEHFMNFLLECSKNKTLFQTLQNSQAEVRGSLTRNVYREPIPKVCFQDVVWVVLCEFWVWSLMSLSIHNIDGLAQDCSNSIALAMELLQSCANPSISVYIAHTLSPTVTCYCPVLL